MRTHPSKLTQQIFVDAFFLRPSPYKPQMLSLPITVVPTTGSITVNLTLGCWGHVNVCLGTRCGGVCNDCWSQNLSRTLCQSLSCGKPVQKITNQESFQEVLISSFHPNFNPNSHTNDLNQSAMVINNDSCNSKPAYVVCSGNKRHPLFVIYCNTYTSNCPTNYTQFFI